MATNYGNDPVHPILDQAWQYDIIRFDLQWKHEDWRSSHLDLWLRRGEELKRLRFVCPTAIRIDEGFPEPTRGMVILDVRHWGWEDVAVAVRNFENSRGGLSFNAKDVYELGGDEECG